MEVFINAMGEGVVASCCCIIIVLCEIEVITRNAQRQNHEKTGNRIAESKAILLFEYRVSIALVGTVAESIILP